MKKILFVLAMLIMSLGVKAQQGWRYQDNCALLESDWDYLSGDVESPTAFTMPLYQYGTHTFNFYTNGYTLDM